MSASQSGTAEHGDPALAELAEAYADGDLVICAGSAISTAAGLPSWSRLVELLAEHGRACSLDAETISEMVALGERGKVVDALSAARGMLGAPEFNGFVARHMDDEEAPIPDVARAIAALAPRLRALLTTNLDHLFERVFPSSWGSIVDAAGDRFQRKRFILKLYGTLVDPARWIVGREEHDRAASGDVQRWRAIASIFHHRTMLFVGYPFEGQELELVMEKLCTVAGDHPPRHYAAFAGSTAKPYRRAQIKKWGLRIIDYPASQDHGGLVLLLREIAGAADAGAMLEAHGGVIVSVKRAPTREDLLALCGAQADAAIGSFLGSSFDDSRYIPRVAERALGMLVDPWQDFPKDQPAPPVSALLLRDLAASLEVGDVEAVRRDLKSLEGLLKYMIPRAQWSALQAALGDNVRSIAAARAILPRIEGLLQSADDAPLPSNSHAELEAMTHEGISGRRLAVLRAAVDRISSLTQEMHELWNLCRAGAMRGDETARLASMILALRRLDPLAAHAREILATHARRHNVLLAHGGKGKTWTLSHLARSCARTAPVLLLFARDPRVFRGASLGETLARILDDFRPDWGVRPETVGGVLNRMLLGDEQLSIIIDGIDWLSDARRTTEEILRWRSDTARLPIRTLISCRTEYWRRFRGVYDGRDDWRVAAPVLGDFSREELDEACKRHGIAAPPEGRELLCVPNILGLALEIANRGSRRLADVARAGTWDVFDAYLTSVAVDAAARTNGEPWWCEHALKTMFGCVLDRCLSRDRGEGETQLIPRTELRDMIERSTGQYHEELIRDLLGGGVLFASDTSVGFTSELVLEFGLARVILARFTDERSAALTDEFFERFDMRRDWFSGRVGVMAFVATRLVAHGIKLWDLIAYDFPERVDLLNQISQYLPPRHFGVDFLTALLRGWTEKMRRSRKELKAPPTPPLLDLSSPDRDSDEQGAERAPSYFAPMPSCEPGELRRWFSAEEGKPGWVGIGDLQAEVNLWTQQFSQRIIPLLQNVDTPLETKLYLIDAATRICSDYRLPMSMVTDVYSSYAHAFEQCGGRLEPDDRLKVLISIHNSESVELCCKSLSIWSSLRGVDGLIDVQVMDGCDGVDVLHRLRRERFSVLVVDVSGIGLTGDQITRLYREHVPPGVADTLSILILTALDLPMYRERCLDAGADVFLTVPIDLEVFTNYVIGYGIRDRVHLAALRRCFLAIQGIDETSSPPDALGVARW